MTERRHYECPTCDRRATVAGGRGAASVGCRRHGHDHEAGALEHVGEQAARHRIVLDHEKSPPITARHGHIVPRNAR